MFEGDLEQGELEIGQVSAQIDQILPVKDIISAMVDEFNSLSEKMSLIKL
jgi:enoyl-[acyl-carrier protein] reductase II